MSPVTLWQRVAAGVFVILCISTWIYMSVALAGPQKGRMYHIFFDEPVRGLAPSSQIFFNGMRIGKVYKISSDLMTNRVRVDILVTQSKEERPIFASMGEKRGTVATLITSFVTGIQYINLSGGITGYPELKDDSEIPYIKGTLANMQSQMKNFTKKFEKLFSDKNIQNIGKTIANVKDITANVKHHTQPNNEVVNKVKALLDKTNALLAEGSKVHNILKNISQLTAPDYLKLDQLVKDAKNKVDKLMASSNKLVTEMTSLVNTEGDDEDVKGLVTKLNGMMSKNEKQIQEIVVNLRKISQTAQAQLLKISKEAKNTMRSVNHFMSKDLVQTNVELKRTLQELGSFVQILKAKPNAMLWGSGVRGRR